MNPLKSTKTHDNLKAAFAGESQANRRYLYFARRADMEGYPDVGARFRDTSEAETGHAFGHLHFRKEVGDRGRDLRVRADVPGLREDRARRGVRGGRGVVRDARQGREVARRPLHQGSPDPGPVSAWA